jgi:hypothetical protein
VKGGKEGEEEDERVTDKRDEANKTKERAETRPVGLVNSTLSNQQNAPSQKTVGP